MAETGLPGRSPYADFDLLGCGVESLLACATGGHIPAFNPCAELGPSARLSCLASRFPAHVGDVCSFSRPEGVLTFRVVASDCLISV